MSRVPVAFVLALLVLTLPAASLRAIAGSDDAPKFEDADEDVEAAEYEVVETDFQDVSRPRVVVRIVVEEADEEETGAAIAEALREALDEGDDAKVGVVFAYGEGDDTDSIFTRGIGEGSTDGKGWTGDRKLLDGVSGGVKDKKGDIFVLVGSAMDDTEDQTALTFPLDPDDDGD